MAGVRAQAHRGGDMIAADFRLYDALNCSLIAIDEAESERPALALKAWREACIAADGLFTHGGTLSAALACVIAAAAPDCEGRYRADLRNALNATALAVIPAMVADRESTDLCMLDADEAVLLLPADMRDALSVILGVIRAMAGMEVAA